MFDDNLKKETAIELLSRGNLNYEEIAETVGVTTKTLREWRRDTRFSEEVLRRAYEELKETLPAIYSVVTKKGLSGDLRAIEIMLARLDRAEFDLAVAQDKTSQFAFTWKKA